MRRGQKDKGTLMKLLKNVVAAAFAVVLAAGSVGAKADVMMTIDDLSTAGVDWSSGALPSGSVVFHGGAVGSWTISNTTALGDGWSDIFGIDLNSLSASSAAGGTLRIRFTETDLAFGNGAPLSVTSAIGGTTQGTVSYASWIDDSNVAFGQAQQLFAGTSNGIAFSAGGNAMAAVSSPFSLTLQVDINHIGKKMTSFDFSASVPEPSSVALLGVALLGAGAATRRRRKA